jgi:hypothetical protein
MKKFYFSLITVLAGLALNAQTLNQANNAPANGDQHSTMQCDSTINPGPSGANVVWSFPTLNIHSSVVANYTTSASVAPGYPANGQVTGSSINDLAYTTSSAASLLYYGGNFKAGTIEASFTYSSPAVYAAYPMSVNTSSTSLIGGTLNVTAPTAQSGNFTGNSAVVADGSGTLILPGATGTFSSVLRVLSTQTLNYTAGFLSGVVTIKMYNYFATGVKAPILTITSETITALGSPSTQSMVTINKDYLSPPTNTATGISEIRNADLEILVFPNPASYVMTFVSENQNAKEVVIYDITGKMLEKQYFYNGKVNLNVGNYNNGLYMYNILNNKGGLIKTGKVTVAH